MKVFLNTGTGKSKRKRERDKKKIAKGIRELVKELKLKTPVRN